MNINRNISVWIAGDTEKIKISHVNSTDQQTNLQITSKFDTGRKIFAA